VEEPHDRELRLTVAAGREAFAGGDLGVAAASFTRALDLARMLDEPHEIGNAAYDLAAVLVEREGPGPRFEALLDESRAGFRRADDAAGLVAADLLAAETLFTAGDSGAAARLLDHLPKGGGKYLAARAHLLRADLAAASDAAAARREFAAACAELGEDAAAPNAPAVRLGLARIQQREGNVRAAAGTFDAAADGFRGRRLLRRMAHALQSAASAYAAAGDGEHAVDRALRAAAAFLPLGENAEAAAAADLAAKTASERGDESAMRRARLLRERAGG
jgi:hypothetical protein